MKGLRERVTAVASIAFGAMWLVAAAAKIAAPLAPHEMVAHVVEPGPALRLSLAAAVTAEVALGTAMVLRAVQGFVATFAGLALASGVLLAVRSSAEELVPCGCLGDVLGTTLDGALVRNAVLGAVLAALILWNRKGKTA